MPYLCCMMVMSSLTKWTVERWSLSLRAEYSFKMILRFKLLTIGEEVMLVFGHIEKVFLYPLNCLA